MYCPKRSIAVCESQFRIWSTLLIEMLNLLATAHAGSLFPILHRKANTCFPSRMAGLPDVLLRGILPSWWLPIRIVCMFLIIWKWIHPAVRMARLFPQSYEFYLNCVMSGKSQWHKTIVPSSSTNNWSIITSKSLNISKANKNANVFHSGAVNQKILYHSPQEISRNSDQNFWSNRKYGIKLLVIVICVVSMLFILMQIFATNSTLHHFLSISFERR